MIEPNFITKFLHNVKGLDPKIVDSVVKSTKAWHIILEQQWLHNNNQ